MKNQLDTSSNVRNRNAEPGGRGDQDSGCERLTEALNDAARSATRRSKPSAPAQLRIVDCRARGTLPVWCVDDDVAALCDSPSAAERLLLLARGAHEVLDAGQPVRDLKRSVSRLACKLARKHGGPTLDDLRSRSPSMQRLLREARLTADVDSTLLLTGETGVGKEHLARAVHASGPRRDKPLIVVNCGALPEHLLESQLFGHERGAFTGADRLHHGFFEAANGGAILLDEIGEMPAHLQVKLLNVLERQEVTRLGSNRPIPIDVRLMAATNRDIEADVARRDFRADLFYRLNVIRLRLPPLRERVEDIPDLAGRFVSEQASTNSVPTIAGIDDEALQALAAYAWPGNVRELRNVVERTLVLKRGQEISFEDLPDEVREPSASQRNEEVGCEAAFEGRTLREVRERAVLAAERAFLAHLLEETGGRVGLTAERAGIRPRSLYDKMKQHGLRKEDFRAGRAAP
jgi:DNA-binding NtrC family response regulator